jgi:hypothetical protein
VRGHREQIADEARHDVREEAFEDTAAVAADARAESGGQPTGDTQAAANREEDPPA